MQDTTLLQMITDDMVAARQLLALLQAESLILHGRDMGEMEQVLAQKQALVILLDQHGRKRSQLLAGMGLPANRDGLQQLAGQSDVGEQLLTCGDELSALINECQILNDQNGSLIQLQQISTAHQLRILNGGDTPTLYDSRGSTALRAKPRPLSQA
ncbi:flagella synthesis protein FlgN [Pseudomonas syringae]|uniref:Flagellar protein FlgN n=1 Tax=Pseudomonas syringae TaxID=317 RepID=A0A9Q4A3S2_PSESX|nr:flagellar protein FlgN [Pseudomonas syringae]MCF5469224.1 flagellar protein FlgN [Pseudomonas syringae]MCF5475467.1 flagellar protein FlgN [Pseudomonas syringae]MCF5485359.1 flagellar protein FlgN [Pseudomonas syringae]MCF5489935.1 flagellar protein FlgN [Pseudomonas syringae]MCF5493563.1 flagellar protein FlgN [Pseudomonas syringae]